MPLVVLYVQPSDMDTAYAANHKTGLCVFFCGAMHEELCSKEPLMPNFTYIKSSWVVK